MKTVKRLQEINAELLDACEAMMKYWDFNGEDHHRREVLFNMAYDKMKSAIAKATQER